MKIIIIIAFATLLIASSCESKDPFSFGEEPELKNCECNGCTINVQFQNPPNYESLEKPIDTHFLVKIEPIDSDHIESKQVIKKKSEGFDKSSISFEVECCVIYKISYYVQILYEDSQPVIMQDFKHRYYPQACSDTVFMSLKY